MERIRSSDVHVAGDRRYTQVHTERRSTVSVGEERLRRRRHHVLSTHSPTVSCSSESWTENHHDLAHGKVISLRLPLGLQGGAKTGPPYLIANILKIS